MQKLLREILRDIRSSAGSRFLFLPKSLSIKMCSMIIYNQIFNPKEADRILVHLVTNELVEMGVLHKDHLLYHRYEFDDFRIYDIYLRTSDGHIFCRGTATNEAEAYAKAIGEVLERTSLRYIDKQNAIFSSEVEIGKYGKALDLDSLPQATEEQKRRYPDLVRNIGDTFAWVLTENLKDGEAYFIPAQCIYTTGNIMSLEKKLVSSSTHGAGGGYTEQDSLRSGIFEIVHRHEFLKSWYMKAVPDRVEIGTIPDSNLKQTIDNMLRRGFTPHLLDYSREAGVPTFICLLEGRGGWYCGGSTSLSALGAIERSIGEAFSSYMWVQQISEKGGNTLTQSFVENVEDGFVDTRLNAYNRVLLFSNSHFVKNFNLSILSGREVAYSDKYDQNQNTFDVREFATKKFGDVYLYKAKKTTLDDYEYYASKVFIPSSYFFSLDEVGSRPVLDGVYPHFTKVNPFP